MNPIIQLLPVDTMGAINSGVIHAANEGRFDSAHARQELTTFATGLVSQENLEAELNLLASRIPAPRRFSYRTASNAEEFLSETDDVRAIGAQFKQVEARGGEVNAATQNKGLMIRLDKDGEGGLPNAAERAAARLTRRLFRNDLVRLISVLIAAAGNTAKTWNTSGDPDVDLVSLIDGSGDKRGIDPNMLLVGTAAWTKRFAALCGSDKAGAMLKATYSPEQVAALLGIERLHRCNVRKQVSASAKSKVLGSYAIAYYVEQNAGLDSATNLARFVTPTAAGDLAVYVDEKPKFIDVTVEHYSLIAAPSTLGVDMYTVS